MSSNSRVGAGMAVGIGEVQRMRGIAGPADTAIIVTPGGFTAAAKKEAAPTQGFRAVVLVDGDLVVETCIREEIGVRKVDIPPVFAVNDDWFQGEDDEDEN